VAIDICNSFGGSASQSARLPLPNPDLIKGREQDTLVDKGREQEFSLNPPLHKVRVRVSAGGVLSFPSRK